MIHGLQALLAPAVMERITLVVNHVLAGEPVATERMRAHAGRRLRLHLEGWPTLLPTPPVLAFAITPAGLLEWSPDGAGADDLTVRVDASNPARLAMQALGGATPPVDIQGDSQLASDVDWLLKNLRWDVAADLERLLGPGPAHEIHRLGRLLAQGMRSALDALRRARDGIDRGRM
jgi:ubiquinone biosynthesis accessory factor UbiJ